MILEPRKPPPSACRNGGGLGRTGSPAPPRIEEKWVAVGTAITDRRRVGPGEFHPEAPTNASRSDSQTGFLSTNGILACGFAGRPSFQPASTRHFFHLPWWGRETAR